MKGYLEDTIAAVSTPIGEGGIGIVRISGTGSVSIAERVFRPAGRAAAGLRNYGIHYGFIVDPFEDGMIDEVLLLLMRSPHSYTREDIVEIQCHGGITPLMRILNLVVRCGARIAHPGEFTRRAFVNGRIDIIQAEAVIDVIRAKSDKACEIALDQLSGRVSLELIRFRDRLIDLIAGMEATVDFPEEEIPDMSREELSRKVSSLRKDLTCMVERSKFGKLYRDGMKVVIVGKPNVGKSSLLNALLAEKRAIVTEYPGTTRDCIQEWFTVKGIPMLLTDTAGIHETEDIIEREGMKKTQEAVESASFVIVVVDICDGCRRDDRIILDMVKEKNYIIAFNKVDLLEQGGTVGEGILEMEHRSHTVRISALNETGIEEMEKIICARVWQGEVINNDECLISNARHRESLVRAAESLRSVEESLSCDGFPCDVCLIDLRHTLDRIAEIFGEHFDEDILDRIFSEFCIGK